LQEIQQFFELPQPTNADGVFCSIVDKKTAAEIPQQLELS